VDHLAHAALVAAVLATGCVHVEATPERVSVWVLGQGAAATGCPSSATPVMGGTATAGAIHGTDAGSPCTSVEGGPISTTLGTLLGTIGGALAGWLVP